MRERGQIFRSKSVLNDHLKFLFVLPPNGEESVKLEAAETFAVHGTFPWQRVWVCCLPHSFCAVSGTHGKFTIDPAPADGEYSIIAWHEAGQTQKRPLTVKGGKARVDFAMKPRVATAGVASTTRSAITPRPGPATAPTSQP